MDENNVIKSIVESSCPHCGKQIYIESLFSPATVGSVFTEEQMKVAKQDLTEQIAVMSIDEEKKEAALKWVKDERTIFGPWEVESIVNSLLKAE